MIYSIIFDWKQTLYDPENRALVAGASELLDYLEQQDTTLYLVGKGAEDMHDEVERLKVKHYFDEIVFVGSEKHPDHYKTYIDIDSPSKTLVIGDKLSSEIEVGNRVGATTVRVRQGKFADDVPETKHQQPDMVVGSLPELITLLDSYFI